MPVPRDWETLPPTQVRSKQGNEENANTGFHFQFLLPNLHNSSHHYKTSKYFSAHKNQTVKRLSFKTAKMKIKTHVPQPQHQMTGR